MNVVGQIDFDIIEVTESYAIGEMPIYAGVLNPYGTVNAGATIWFADVVATTLALEGVNVSAGMKGFPLAINLAANLTGNSTEGVFTARAEYVKKGRSVSVIRTTVSNEKGRLIADVTTSHVSST